MLSYMNRIKNIRLSYFFIVILISAIFLKSIFLDTSAGNYVLQIFLVVSIFYGLIAFKVNYNSYIRWQYILFIVSMLLSSIITLSISPLLLIFYLLIYYSHFFVWMIYLPNRSQLINNVFYFFAIVMALSGVYQFHFDPTIGGYSLYQYPEEITVTLRATGFIGSPQVLSFLMVVALFQTHMIQGFKYLIVTALFVYVGLLSGGGAFGGALMMYSLAIIVYSKDRWKRLLFASLGALVLLFIGLNSDNDLYMKDVAYLNAIKLGVSSHIPYYVDMFNNIEVTFFGNGLGSANRLSEIYFGFQWLYPDLFIEKTESAWISILHERGIFGVVGYLALIIASIYHGTRTNNKEEAWFNMIFMLYLMLNMLFTPVLTGFTGSFIGLYFILRPIFLRGSRF